MLNFSRRTFKRDRLSKFEISLPSIDILPSVGSIKRLIKRINVDLPLPDNPIITKNSPSFTSKFALLTATVQPVSLKISSFEYPSSKRLRASFVRLPNTFDKSFTSITDTQFHL